MALPIQIQFAEIIPAADVRSVVRSGASILFFFASWEVGLPEVSRPEAVSLSPAAAPQTYHTLTCAKRICSVMGGTSVGPASRDLTVEKWRLEQVLVGTPGRVP